MAEAGPPDELRRARIDLLHAQIAFAKSRGNEATPLLLAAARRLERLDVALARETYLDAVAAAIFAGRLARGPGLREVGDSGARRAAAAAAAGARRAAGCPCRASHGRLLGIGADDGASPRERSVTRRSPSRRRCAGSGLHRSSLRICGTTSAGSVVETRHVTITREAGALSELPRALDSLAVCPPLRRGAGGGHVAGSRRYERCVRRPGATRHASDRSDWLPCAGASARPAR